jgi:hypothetical protein
VRARLAHALNRRFAALSSQVSELRAEVQAGRTEMQELREAIAALGPALERIHDRVAEARVDDQVIGLLRELVIDDGANRRRLERLRARPDYELPYTAADPLVSICIATRSDRVDLLVERAIPSALAQTHEHIEVIVVGDGFDPLGDPRVRALDDPRLRVGSVAHRIVDRDRERARLIGATLPRVEARSLARGLWITDLDDDDALRPDAVAALLDTARQRHAEVASGLMAEHRPDGGDPRLLAGFPPDALPAWSGLPGDWRARACTAALSHPGLRFFTRVRAAAIAGAAGDLFLTIRMARVGVRFAVLDRVVYDYYPGPLWQPDGVAPGAGA